MTIRVLVADDHLVVREGLVAILDTAPSVQVVGEASDGVEALSLVALHAPDVILLDLQMPKLDGIGVIKHLRQQNTEIRILVFTAYEDDDLIVDAVRAGIDGYLLKGTGRDALLTAIETVAGGGSLLEGRIASRLLARIGPDATMPKLTPRQTDVLELLAQGLSNKEIAGVLAISPRTAKFHVASLFEKLEVDNRTEAVTRALQLRLIEI